MVFNYLGKKNDDNSLVVDNLLLPNSFKIFLKLFQLENYQIKHSKFLFKEDLISLTCLEFRKADYRNNISTLYDIQAIKQELHNYAQKKSEYYNEGFIVIGHFDKEDSILLGVTDKNMDEIWKGNGGDWGIELPRVEKISDNIFTFMSNCHRELIWINLHIRGVNSSQLYKNWGEDFWRIREETNDTQKHPLAP
jgi:hypothetical protein